MHFGRVADEKGLDLSLPHPGKRTEGFLKLPHEGRGLIYCGAPIWSCKDWSGTVYPTKARPSEYLRHYAKHYATVELNSSFYSIPTPDQVRLWKHEVGPEFRFCPKMAKDLSHSLHKVDRDLLKHFITMLEGFGENLGLPFMQLPEWYAVDQFPALEAFIAQWPKGMPLAVEFRHPSWFQGPMLLDPVINFLYKNKLATVITDTPGRRDVVHMSLTYPSLLLRFMGVFPSKNDQIRLKAWLDRLEDWAHAGMDSIYVAVHQERNGSIPQTIDFMQRYLHGKKFEGLVEPLSNDDDESSSSFGGDDDDDEVLVLR